MRKLNTILLLFIMTTTTIIAQQEFESDILKTSQGNLEMYFIGHGTLMFTFNELVIHIDPVSREADYSKLPDADLVLVTHEHGDHLDQGAIDQVKKKGTVIIMTQRCQEQLENFDAQVMKNGESGTYKGISVEACPAYNIKHTRSAGKPFHPKGDGNAYLLTFGDTRVLIGGDTENIPELKTLKDIDVAFLPMNLPYTMEPEMVADLALSMKPSIIYPYHYGNTDPQELVTLLKGQTGIEVRIRELQ